MQFKKHCRKNGGGIFMEQRIRKAAVIGAGVMGAGIAAHLANVGIPTYLLDIVLRELTKDEEKAGLTLNDPQVRNRLIINAKAALLKAKPSPLYQANDADLIVIGNMEDNLNYLADADWIIEVVVENLKIKKNYNSIKTLEKISKQIKKIWGIKKNKFNFYEKGIQK